MHVVYHALRLSLSAYNIFQFTNKHGGGDQQVVRVVYKYPTLSTDSLLLHNPLSPTAPAHRLAVFGLPGSSASLPGITTCNLDILPLLPILLLLKLRRTKAPVAC